MSSVQPGNVIGCECVECARTCRADAPAATTCPACGGNLDVLYDYDRVRAQLSKAALAAARDFSMWRYRPLLPVAAGAAVPPLTVGWTPLQDAPRLAARYGVGRLLLKDEGRNPTASLKDRPSALAVVRAAEAGARTMTVASSGNAGSALAGMCASVGVESVIFVPATVPRPKLTQLQIYGATVVLVEGSYDEAFDLCAEAALRFGWYQRSTGINPFMTEGKKTVALEIGEQLGWQVPDKVFVAMGDGCVIGGLWKGFRDLHRLGFIERLPQLIGVQAEHAAAIVDAVDGTPAPGAEAARTVADSICVGRPRDATKAIRAIRESDGLGVKVSDREIIDALGQLAAATGVFVEPAAAAAFAGFVKCCGAGQIKSGESVLLVLTGHGLKDVAATARAHPDPIRIRPNLADLMNAVPARVLSQQ